MDLIDRREAIRIASGYCHPANIAKELAKLLSAQPEKRTEERTKTHACDCISRAAAVDIVRNIIVKEVTPAYMLIDKAEVMTALKSMPSAQPDTDEWCTDCKEYDHERHCCPRWNRVIRETLKDAQPEIVRCKDCKYWREYKYVSGRPKYLPYCGFNDSYFREDDYCSHAERREG